MQEWIVAVIVGYAAWIVLKRYAPKRMKRGARTGIQRTLTLLGWRNAARKFDIEAPASRDGGCGTCAGCHGADAPPAEKKFTISAEALKRTASR
jgi:cytochrome c553